MAGKVWRYLIVLFTAGFLLVGCGGSSDPGPAAPQTTTLMVYMVGSDLESGRGAVKGTAAFRGAATQNIQEMLAATSSGKLNVVLTTGGALKDDPANLGLVKSWRTVKRHLIRNGKIEELADLGSLNMGNPATLSDFIAWAKSAYPADRYMLMFWDHGGGYQGFGGDENFIGDNFKVPEMVAALKKAKETTGITFDFIGFDACLMATVEIANAIAPYAKYLGASQELEPGSGWNWTVILNTLARNPGIDALAFGRALADGFIAKQKAEADEARRQIGAAYAEDRYNTFSIIDLARIPNVVNQLEAWAKKLLASGQLSTPAGWLKVAEARSQAMSFGGSVTKDQDSYDLVDLSGFAQRLEAAGIAAAESRALRDAVKGAVAYRNTGDLVADTANGLSAFFPSRSLGKDWASNLITRLYEPIGFSTIYNDLVKAHVSQAAGTPAFINIAAPAIDPATKVISANVASTLGIKEAHVVLSAGNDGGEPGKILIDGVMRADFTSGYGGVFLNLTAGWLTLNGKPFAVVDISPEHDETGKLVAYRYVIPILLNGVPTSLEVRESEDGMEVIGSWEGIGDDSVPARAGNPILPDDDITLLRVKLDTASETAEITQSPVAAFKAGAMTFDRGPLPAGAYNLRFVVTDFAENDKFSAAVNYVVP